MRTIVKKVDPEWFEMINSGKKKFELRLADFTIEEGDTFVWRNGRVKAYRGNRLGVFSIK